MASKLDNKRPDKGFAKEIAKANKTPAVTKPHSKFSWERAVVNPPPTQAIATPHRMREFKSVAPTESFVKETQTHIKKRRGEE